MGSGGRGGSRRGLVKAGSGSDSAGGSARIGQAGHDGTRTRGAGAGGDRVLVLGYGRRASGTGGAGLDLDVAGEAAARAGDFFSGEGGGQGGEGAGGHGGRRLDVEKRAVGGDSGAAGVVADAVVGGLEEEVVLPGGDEVAMIAVACEENSKLVGEGLGG